jgi:asparagine synthase (glutamine-hydrolysing)
VSDVPVGLLLSGGIDSGAIAGLMVDCGVEQIHAVTVTFPEFAGKHADEVPGATSTAAASGLRHTIRPVTEREFYDDLPRILSAVDQPSVDGINTWYATKAISEEGLKVALSGVGGDELFLGYKSFSSLPSIQSTWSRISGIPFAMHAARFVAGLQARRTRNSRWSCAPEWFRTIPGAWWARRGLFGPADLPGLMGEERARDVLAAFTPESWILEASGELPGDPVLALAQIESTTYLRNQLLRDSDWASMDHSVELRTPLVDAWLLRQVQPMLGAFKRFPKKRLLAGAPRGHLTDDVALRSKTGFGTPIQQWLSSAGLAGRGEGATRGWGRYLAQHLYAS